ncbi:hypothetical protein LAG90_18550 [Marinilongibacter aquaticus]|uniref:3-coathanger stack domain-containing protein n=1 Tax=Marinilongibacter aquaticus TaxID=2975157 RepID=UPI0021BD4C06|nr:3-coathanger stack domain-containing protein [Marinilongibacter aquaticus]UBM58801.1 hypothetical protein LAG90_18550 [Marinilongibacter aquaticus]
MRNTIKLIACSLVLCIQTIQGQTVRYIKTTVSGTGDGTSWANASTDIQAMLDANGVDEVWVAKGTYKPMAYPTGCSNCSSSRDYSFSIPAGKKLVGGFTGTENTKSQRDIAGNRTVLSGDIGSPGVKTDNTYHVIVAAFPFNNTAGNSCELDGLVIKSGYSPGASGTVSVNGQSVSRGSGAGAHLRYGDKIIKDCSFEDNTAQDIGGGVYILNDFSVTANVSGVTLSLNKATKGGGIYISSGESHLDACYFDRNSATEDGGGLYASFADKVIINACKANGNGSTLDGGAMYFDIADVELYESIFTGNSASQYGGAIFNARSDLVAEQNYFGSNSSKQGGAVELYYDDSFIRRNLFDSNITLQYTGGAIHSSGTESDISGNVFYNNYGFVGGGALGLGGNLTIANNLFYGNRAKYWGGAIYLFAGDLRTVTNNTFVMNTATNYGAGVYTNTGTNNFYNNIFWANDINGNTADTNADFYNYQADNLFTYNGMQFSQGHYTSTGSGTRDLGSGATGNTFAVDPLFLSENQPRGADNVYGTADDGFALTSGSPFVNRFSPNGPSSDITGASRDGSPDWGAYEFGASNCPENLMPTGLISTDQKADAYVSTSGSNTIDSGAAVGYQAGHYITLNPGFSAEAGSVFRTEIQGGCQ